MTKQQLIEDNMNLVYSVIHKEYPTYLSDEDIVQCGMLGLVKAADKWDESKAKFSTFAYTCISNEIKREFRRRMKYQGTLSLDYELNGEDGRSTLGELIVGDEDVVCCEVNTDSLTDRELQILELLQKGLSQSDIARRIGVTRQAVWAAMRKIRIKNTKKRGWLKYVQ